MKSTSARKILSALLVICLAVLIVPVFATPAGAEAKTNTLNADDLQAFGTATKTVQTLGKSNDDLVIIHDAVVSALEDGKFRADTASAVIAAYEKTKKLGQ